MHIQNMFSASACRGVGRRVSVCDMCCVHVEVTGKIEEFLQGVPEQIATGVEYVANQVNDTLGFINYMRSTASGIATHLADNVKALENASTSRSNRPPSQLSP